MRRDPRKTERMAGSFEGFPCSWILAAVLAALSLSWAAPCRAAGVLSIEIVNGYNLVVDSNTTSPSTYAPKSAFIGAFICNTGDAPLNNVVAYVGDYVNGVADTPGLFPVLNSGTQSAAWDTAHPELLDTGDYALTLEAGEAGAMDGTRYIGTLAPGECRIEYWLFSYPQCINVDPDGDGIFEFQSPPCDASICGGIKPNDDLSLDYDVWATTTTGGVAAGLASRKFTMRNEISASANKIWPNTTSKVPDEYLAAIQSVVGWGTLGPDGQPLTDSNPVYPGQRVITTQGIWYDLGNVVHGFDNNQDLVVDQNAWLQPVGDPSSFDAGCFRMVNVYGIVIVKLKTGGELLIPFQNQLYFENLPDNTGAVGLVYYQFIATGEGCSANMTPYQEAASGYDNEKFSADYGLSLGLASASYGADLNLSKSDGVASTAAGNTLTYSVTADNSGTGVNLGAPDLGMPLTFSETIPPGTTFVAGSADDSPAANLTEAAGTGTYTQGYTDEDGNLDLCPINYNVTGSSYVILYSDDNGVTWTTTEPAGVTNIKWMLLTTLALDGFHDGTDCVAPNGAYDNGTLDTSLPAGQFAEVKFQVTVNSDVGPVLCNTANMGFGLSGQGVEAEDCTLVSGNNSLSGTIFQDNEGTTGIFGNGAQDGDEAGIGNATDGVTVSLYYDLNGDGEYTSEDILYGTTTAAANGDYSFGSLPDGPYLVVTKKYDGPASDGVDNAVEDFKTGWGNTTYDPNLSPLTDQGILKMTEDFLQVILAVNIDLDRSTGTAQSVTSVDFGFAPPLKLTKSVAGNPDADDDGKADSPVDEGSVFNYNITLENRLPSVGVQGPTGCQYTVWSMNGVNGSPASKAFTNYLNAFDAPGPNRSVASALVSGGGNRFVYGTGFGLSDKPGSITKVEGLFFGYFSTTLTDDYLSLTARIVWTENNGTVSTAQIESYVGEPADLDPNSSISWDISGRKPGGTGSVTDWSFSDFSTLQLEINPSKTSAADQKTFYLDALGVRVTTDADCVAGQSTTLSPVPLQDTYDPARFEFVSADPAPLTVNTVTGVIQWEDVGPIMPGTSKTVIITMRALDVSGTVTGACSGSPDACNQATTDFGAYDVLYADGRQANDGSDEVAVDIVGKAELRGSVWLDNNPQDGWPDNDGEARLPGVSVTLYGCVRSDGITLETGTSTSKDCETITGGNYWATMATAVTDANGAYEFIGLDTGYYIVEVGDTDNAPSAGTGGNTSPFGATQRAEPDDDQSTTSGNADAPTQGTFNNTWGVRTAILRSTQVNINLLSAATEETVNNINFGYSIPNAVIYGNVWHDVDGDTAADPGDSGLSGFPVALFDDTDADGDPDGSAISLTTTDSDGGYFFSGLSADDYVVVVTPPTMLSKAWEETVETTGGTSSLNDQIPVTVTAGQFSGSHDFGYTQEDTSDIGDTVYFDFDGDGFQDPGEAGIPNITVWLYRDVDRDGNIDAGVDSLIGTDVTDANGKYLFEDLSSGSYVVKVDTADPDFPTLASATGDPDTNAASIGDKIWLDADGDGVQDAGEDGIPAVVVILYEDTDASGALNAGDKVVAATSTDLDGNYLFTGLNAGGYFVDVDETTLPSSALVLTSGDPVATPALITLSGRTTATQNLTADAGYSPSVNYALGNRVWSDADGDGVQDPGEAGIGNVDITVTGTGCAPCRATTDKSGYWIVTGVSNGATYAVAVDTADLTGGFASTTGGNTQNRTISGADNMAADFGYRYDGDGDGVADEDTGDPTGTITGTVFLDKDNDQVLDPGEAMGGARVSLISSGGSLMATTTDAGGAYSFTGVAIGTYLVRAVDQHATRYSTIFLSAGETFSNLNVIYNETRQTTPDHQSSVSVGGVHADLKQDFGYRRFLGSIGDTVYHDVNENSDQDFGEPGLPGVTVDLYLWADAVADGGNGDGLVDSGELTLFLTQDTTADDPLTPADEGGKYLFTNLAQPPADQYYMVRVDTATLPGTWTLIADPSTDGYPCQLLPDPDDPGDDLPPPGVCDSLQVVDGYTEGVNYLGADFGYQIAGAGFATVGDTLWVDANMNGVMDGGELGVPYVTVFFDADNDGALDWTDGNGNGEWDSGEGERWTETDPNGYYVFTNLADGTYNYLSVFTADADWPSGLVATPVYETRTGNNDSLDNKVNVIVGSGAVTSIEDGDADTTDTCSGCDLSADWGYLYTVGAGNSLIGTVCVDDSTGNGYCGSTATTYTGVDAGNESPLSAIQISFYRWNDGDGDNTAWAADGTLDPGDTFTLLGGTSTDANGDYSFAGLPDKILVVLSVSESQNLSLTTTNANTSVEDGGVLSHQLYVKNQVYDGNTVTVLARQALDIAGDADDAVKDLDFAFDGTLGGTVAYDFGDLPATYNNTLLSNGGARALVTASSLYLGTDPGDGVSTEIDGAESATATGDTHDDGVNLVSTNWRTGQDGASVVVEASDDGWLAGWVDFNQDGDFADFGERIINEAVTAGDNTIPFSVPDFMPEGANTFFARFRIYPSEPFLVSSSGLAMDASFEPVTGEVEDYQWNTVVTLATLSSFSAHEEGGRVWVEWETASELGTAGFYLDRLDKKSGQYARLTPRLLPGLIHSPQGGVYRFADPGVLPGETHTYRLVEMEMGHRMREHGPFVVTVKPAVKTASAPAMMEMVSGFGRAPHPSTGVRKTGAMPEAARLGLTPFAETAVKAPSAARKRSPQEPAAGKIFVETGGITWLDAATLAGLLERTEEETRALIRDGNVKLTCQGRDIAWEPVESDQGICFHAQGSDTIFTRYNVYWLTEGQGVKMQDAAAFGDCNDDGAVDLADALSCLQALSGNQADGFTSTSGPCWDFDQNLQLEMPECLKAFQTVAGLYGNSQEETAAKQAGNEDTFPETFHAEGSRYEISSLFDQPDADFWVWDVIYCSPGYDQKDFPVRADGVSRASGGLSWLSVRLRGGSATPAPLEHHAKVFLNGTPIGEGLWDGDTPYTLELTFDTSLLNDGENTVTVSGVLDESVDYSIFYVDSLDLDYPRVFKAHDNLLDLPATGRAETTVSGFDSSDVQVLEMTNPDQPRIVTNLTLAPSGDGFQVSFHSPSRFAPYLVLARDAYLSPAAVEKDRASDLKNPENQAAYVVVCPDSLAEAAETLAAYRTQSGLPAMVATLSDIMDEFSHGVFTPLAVRDFLAFARDNWTVPPRYVVLAGKGTLDYKDYLGFGDNLVPPILASTPYGLFTSDNRFVMLDGETGDRAMAVGRLPVTSVAELASAISRIQAYEQAGPGDWSSRVMFLADNPDDGGNFPADSDALAAAVPASYTLEKIYLADLGLPAARTRLLSGINSGALLMNYLGHGGYDRLTSEGLLTSDPENDDMPKLVNGAKLPFLAALTCVTARSMPGFSPIAERLMMNPAGGAVAVWSPTGPSANEEAAKLDGELLKALFTDRQNVLGDAVKQALNAYGQTTRQRYMLDIYNLLGDPALTLHTAP